MGLNEVGKHVRSAVGSVAGGAIGDQGWGPAGQAVRNGGGEGPPRSFRIDIGELVLDGFDARVDPARVSAAFTSELTRLVHERGIPLAADGTGVALDGLTGLPPLPATTSAVRLGEALARAVHAGLTGRGEAR
ncbi:hypothetical protein YWIDRAFT_00968 [Streptomyces sp. SceaMP-e96]|uniref:hypothetical protein n=1 Tax=unclassified Streptomyces TaxID=2593676 RepID=UPI000823815E|nr:MULTISPECIES: hypothetical protein [unclassified Streptomyces]SCK11880.1 hypothetical protein YWIDRAFT_00968 [Streptomyces sp. SceaMP-e96]